MKHQTGRDKNISGIHKDYKWREMFHWERETDIDSDHCNIKSSDKWVFFFKPGILNLRLVFQSLFSEGNVKKNYLNIKILYAILDLIYPEVCQ